MYQPDFYMLGFIDGSFVMLLAIVLPVILVVAGKYIFNAIVDIIATRTAEKCKCKND